MKRLFLIFALSALFPALTAAQTSGFNFQGRLNDGANPANGNVELQFKLFDSLSGGNQIGAVVSRPSVAVINGVFSTQLDFGAAAFDGSPRFIEIGVRPAGSTSPFTILAPRQPILSTPYSLRALKATTADTATNALQLGGIPASEYVTTTTVGNSFIKNATNQQTGNFNISGNGIIGGNLGIGIAPSAGVKLDVNGAALFRTTGSGGNIQLGNPNGETGMSIVNTNRADIKFDNSALRLVVGSGPTPPLNTNGITINMTGNVGIGVASPTARLDVFSPVAGGRAIYAEGNVAQNANSKGLVKAMLRVNASGTITDCHNGFTNNSIGNCGITVTHTGLGDYIINFGQPLFTAFASVEAYSGIGIGATHGFFDGTMSVRTFATDGAQPADRLDWGFTVIVF